MKTFKQHFNRRTAIAAGLVAALTVPTWAVAQQAQQAQPAQPSAEQKAKMQQVIQEYREITQKLNAIRQETVQANPELKQQRQAFQAMVQAEMAENGYNVEAEREELKLMREELQSEEVGKDRKQELAQDFRQERRQLQKAQKKALKNPEVKEAGEKLREDTLSAMKAQDSQTEVLLAQLKDLRSELRSAAPGNS